MTDWQDKAHRFAAELTTLGVLEPGWRAAFASVPRHLFVPSFYRDDNTIMDGASPELRAEWLAAIYRDESLTTQQIQVPGTDMMWPTSSSTQPSLMARMLSLLDMSDNHTVMEIGTGTGYNAALLSHRLGDGNVASIDIDPTLVEQARTRLDQAGYRPFLAAGDGAGGIPARAPFDRIIATCAVPAIPASWVAQLRDQGVIVADVRGEMSSALVTATKIGPDTVQGRFLAVPGHFMWLRANPRNPLRDGGRLNTVIDIDGARRSTTTVAPSVLSNHEFRFMLNLSVPSISFAGHIDREHGRVHLLRTSDGSWAEIDATSQDGRHPTAQGGSRSVWDEVEAAAKQWADLGRPDRSRFGLTATSTGAHHIWLDDPDNIVNQ
ncbi:MAG: methyltransferase domain-containing protein [Pseudonocardia sp.]